jgi:hypothetical protein
MMLFPASSLFRRLATAVGGLRQVRSRHLETEFPAASQIACRLPTHSGLWFAGCASFDALLSHDNWVNIEDQHDISFIGETSAPFAWWLPTKGRSRAQSTFSGNAFGEAAPKEDVLAAHRCLFQRQRPFHEATGNGLAQWFAVTTTTTAAEVGATIQRRAEGTSGASGA